MNFSLSKWYLDCVTDQGDAYIGYAAVLSLGAFQIHYSSLLTADASGATRSRTTLKRATPPMLAGDTVTWFAPTLEIEGRWERDAASLHVPVFESEEGSVDWRCHLPNARVTLSVKGREVTGRGYAEHLSLTVAPWKLPLRELRWGRALSADHALVWIDWRGDEGRRRYGFLDGAPLGDFSVDDEAITDSDGATLARFEGNQVLRTGTLGSTALGVLGPVARSRIPGSALLLDETKWKARTALGGSPGHVIHERVLWP